METGRQRLLNIMEDGLGRDLLNAGRFCFSCEQIFANRKCLEEHVCASASFICSCGTEFTDYSDMLEHSTKHEPGQQALDHETIKKRRLEKRMEEEEKLKRLQRGEVVWETPKLDQAPSILAQMKQVAAAAPLQAAPTTQVPPQHTMTKMKNAFSGVGAPTVDLWTLYQPVVLLKTMQNFSKTKSYTCGKCGQCFTTKAALVSHHSSHVTDKVSGCIGCGLLLSSKKLVPRFHTCHMPTNSAKLRIITARPLRPNVGLTSPTPRLTSTPPVKNQNVRPYNRSNQALNLTLSLQSKNPTTSKSHIRSPPPLKTQSPHPVRLTESSPALPITSSAHVRRPMNSGMTVRQMLSPPSPNGYACRVCHISFETAQLLQRHKCIKAQEFMAQHGRGGKQQFKIRRVTPAPSSSLAQVNGDRKLGVVAAGNLMKKPAVPVDKTGADMEDDCYIVESGSDKSAEMIYQVTSSVPIKT